MNKISNNSNNALPLNAKLSFIILINLQQSCFVNDELVVWVENSDSAPRPPQARGAAKGPGPIDPKTGKPLFGLVANFGAAFGAGGGGGGGGGT